MTTERYRQVWTARARRFLLGGLLLPGLLLLGACRKAADAADNAGASTAPADAGIDLLVDRGPLRFRVHADKKAVDLIETLTLRVEAVAPEDVAVELAEGGPTNELEEIVWLPLGEAKQADIPTITRTVLGDLEARLKDDPGLAPGGPVPFYYLRHNRFRRDIL